ARHRRIRNGEVIPVAGAHTDRAVGARRRTIAARIHDRAEQRAEESARTGRGVTILWAAIVLRQLAENGAALTVLIVVALELFEIAQHLVEVAAHLLNACG